MPTRFDPEEISKFEALAGEWWDPAGRFRPLHKINPLRLDYIAAKTALDGADVLDVGCGGGLLAEGMARLGAAVTAIDRSEKALAAARTHAKKKGIDVDYASGDAETWAASHTEYYDVITCLEVLEHVPDVPATLAACARMLRPGGVFFFATLNRTLKSYLFAIVGAEYLLGWLPRGTHRWERFVRPSELILHLERKGFEPEEIRGMEYDPLKRRFFLSRDPAVNYLGFARRP